MIGRFLPTLARGVRVHAAAGRESSRAGPIVCGRCALRTTMVAEQRLAPNLQGVRTINLQLVRVLTASMSTVHM